MPGQEHKLSGIMKEMAETLLRDPQADLSSEAVHVALVLANAAWNECVGIRADRRNWRTVWEPIAAENPGMWSEFRSSDTNAMIDDLVRYKRKHYPDDHRRIIVCGMVDGNVRVEWLKAAEPGVDPSWEMQLYGLVRVGSRKEAIRFLQETRGISRKEASRRVSTIASDLRML
jgi:hypothetical protein